MKSRKNLYVGLFIIFLMVSSTLGFFMGDDPQGREKGGLRLINGWWILEQDSFSYRFSRLPEDVGDYEEVVVGGDIYLYGEDLSQSQLSRLSYFFAANGVRYSVLDEEDCDLGKPTLIIREGLDKAYKEGNCFFLEGDLDTSIDKIGYNLVL